MYQREYFCVNCGLFYWEGYPSKSICPNEKCESHSLEDGQLRYACDTMGYAYFSRDNVELIKNICWTSSKFTPEFAIEIYKKQGVLIKDL